jgi:nitrite reductase/ring-hydroxylating ferredoxin subunit
LQQAAVVLASPPMNTEAQGDVVAVYERTIRASLERVWENVLDWEHLPWLHKDSFRDITLRSADRDGWHADAVLADGSATEVRVTLERAAMRYTTSTISGVGAGTDIVTRLTPVGERSTGIRVEFHVPGIEDAQTRAFVGDVYLKLYETLWDEDERMMGERQQQLDARKEVGREIQAEGRRQVAMALGREADVRARVPFVVDWSGGEFRIVEVDGALLAHSTVCPHLLGPLADAPVEGGAVTCPWHGYRFDLRSGKACDGRGFRLARAPRVRVDEAGNVLLEAAGS